MSKNQKRFSFIERTMQVTVFGKFIRVLIEVCHGSLLSLFFCLRHYKVKFDINPDYIF